MTQEMIHELIFDFVNGKTKSFKFDTKEEARDLLHKPLYFNLNNKDFSDHFGYNYIYINDTGIFLAHVCSITYNSYPKPKDEHF